MGRTYSWLFVAFTGVLAACGGAPAQPAPTYRVGGVVSGATAPVGMVLSGSGLERTVQTSAAGDFLFEQVPPGRYTVTPRLQGHRIAPASATVAVQDRDVAGLSFTAQVVYAVSGAVTGAAGTPVALTVSGPGLPWPRTVESDSTGRYLVDDLLPGNYTVVPVLRGYGFTPAAAQTALLTGPQSSVDFAAAPRATLEVWGADMGADCQNAFVHRDGAGVSDAEVRVGGLRLGPGREPGQYAGCLGNLARPGQALVLTVTSGALTVSGEATVPPGAVLVSPADGSNLPAGRDLDVTWQCPTDPDRFSVHIRWSCGPSCGAGRTFDTAGSARAFTVPAADLPAGLPISVTVYSYANGALSGDYAAWPLYPGMNVRAESGTVAVTR